MDSPEESSRQSFTYYVETRTFLVAVDESTLTKEEGNSHSQFIPNLDTVRGRTPNPLTVSSASSVFHLILAADLLGIGLLVTSAAPALSFLSFVAYK
ncbi:hypothetical protein CEXT_179061 [Caerostris extrusa]|uniref:Uncharacterized protein n=1 Tax=Caerostris extrusa TaxID=172846 RepID=A0AAV4RXC6_CAEEX|nr:hypothetical protein CEXT_179061 [Caerostris extrusa]